MKTNRVISYLCLLLFPSIILGQLHQIKKADQKFKDLAFADAREMYQKLAGTGRDTANIYLKLADTYYMSAQYAEASQWYDKLYRNVPAPPIDVLFRYGQSVKASGNYNKADLLLQRYFESQGAPYLQSNEYLPEIERLSGRFEIHPDFGPSGHVDYPAFYRNDTLYVVSNGKGGVVNAWDNSATSDILIALDDVLEPLPGKVNSKYNEGSMTMARDGRTLYFTRNDFSNDELGADMEKVHRLKLYRATRSGKDQSWGNITELPFSHSNYSVGHPALGPKGDKLYFVSDMPHERARGGTDLYVVDILEDGSFTTPRNMEEINTVGNEMFPFVSRDGTLYFSSNGHPSLGGLDVFLARPETSGTYSTVYNVGKPVNGPLDDFAFMIDGDQGYFASNREGMDDAAYRFTRLRPFEDPSLQMLMGTVWDKGTGDVLEHVEVQLLDKDGNTVHKISSDSEGEFLLEKVDRKVIKTVLASNPGYLEHEAPFEVPEGEETHLGIAMQPEAVALPPGMKIGDTFTIVYFDFDDATVRIDSEKELKRTMAALKEYKALKIKVTAHTDSRGSKKYNMALSEKRAKEVVQYLLAKGSIAPDRVTGAGYGESRPAETGCADGAKCSEKRHQKNRRAELVISN